MSTIFNYQSVIDDSGLAKICANMGNAPLIALDTEFIRTRTYYPQPGLLQLYDGETIALIDPLAISNWQPFRDLLSNSSQLKVLHASSEDLELLLTAYEILPAPFLDTQVLAAFSGHPLSCSFAMLVQEYLQVTLDKSATRTDWLARPLTAKQCHYAAADVFYLLPLAEQLISRCQEAGWLKATYSESELFAQRQQRELLPEQAYYKIGNASQLNSRQLACLQLLAAWRLNEAQQADLAINFVIQEAKLWHIAHTLPTSLAQLSKLELRGREIRLHGDRLLALVEQANSLPESALPPPVMRIQDQPDYKNNFKIIKELLQQVAEQTGLSCELLGSRRQINQLLKYRSKLQTQPLDQLPLPELLWGWRGELLGERLADKLS